MATTLCTTAWPVSSPSGWAVLYPAFCFDDLTKNTVGIVAVKRVPRLQRYDYNLRL